MSAIALDLPAAERPGPALSAAERGLLPDALVRLGIRRLLRERRDQCRAGGPAAVLAREQAFVAALRDQPLAEEQAAANRQHYEVPAEFYRCVLGPRRKYSACLFEHAGASLAEAEEAALAATAARAGLADGQRILELGCGWGSLSLWMAERLPGARITAVSNSRSQRGHIEAEAARRGLGNLTVVTADLAGWDTGERFERVVSVECFEHLRNWPELFRRIAGWLAPGGQLFFHVFTHREHPYLFETGGDGNWLGRHFFTGGMMPSDRMPAYLQEHLRLQRHWRWEGTHYARTARAWLANLDRQRSDAEAILAADGHPEPRVQVQRWRMFLMACEELWGFDRGREWLVSHYLMARP